MRVDQAEVEFVGDQEDDGLGRGAWRLGTGS